MKFLNIVLGILFLVWICFFWLGPRSAGVDVPRGATCGRRMGRGAVATGWLGNYALHSAQGRGTNFTRE